MDDERRRKIEAGKQKLAEFKKKRLKSKTKIAVENPNPSPTVGCSSLQNTDEDKTSCSVDNSNIESLNMKAESKVPSSDEISTDLAMDSSSQFSEVSILLY
ncbi:hypothetical protein HNY73_018691 [Argiope bruennichi]|uniref:Uncharacterized protein n=1 Tax=Argiope bruennichi TaxID=94029 RepID=A0A8T0EEJ8_ARGBR|nr:hypothetical protein HNY73_018691 [Argiope bruennichi]